MTRDREGFTLIEILVAIVILGTVGIGIVGLLLTSARRARDAGAISYRTGALAAEVSRITAIPVGTTLANGTVTTTVTAAPFPHTISTVTTTSGTTQTIVITVTPTGPRAIPAVSRTLTRTLGVSSNPFNP
ncbi:MAG TPA: type II secretion system protein [Gemmatimonadales bacterium]|nr:type II secretion system protein [Gemmatimonadales bacterium]